MCSIESSDHTQPSICKSKQHKKRYFANKLSRRKPFSQVVSCCDNKCFTIFSKDQQESLYKKFCLDPIKKIEFLYQHIVVRPVTRHSVKHGESVRNNTRQYYLPNNDGILVLVCKALFKSVLILSNGSIDRALKKRYSNIKTSDNNNTITCNADEQINTAEIHKIISIKSNMKKNENEFTSSESNISEELMDQPPHKLAPTENITMESIIATMGLETVSETKQAIYTAKKHFSMITTCCSKKCFEHFNEDEQQEVFNQFNLHSSYNDQNSIIFNNIKVLPVARHYKSQKVKEKNNTRKFYVPYGCTRRSVCKKFFTSILGVSNGRIDRVLKGCRPPEDMRGRHTPINKTSEEKLKKVSEAIVVYSSDSYRSAKNKSINVKAMYKKYSENEENPVSEFVFRSVYKSQIK